MELNYMNVKDKSVLEVTVKVKWVSIVRVKVKSVLEVTVKVKWVPNSNSQGHLSVNRGTSIWCQ